jgi:Tol biopolymer transport system component
MTRRGGVRACGGLLSGVALTLVVLPAVATGGTGWLQFGKPTTTRVSMSSSAKEPKDGNSFLPSVSADGRYVAFDSDATNLVRGDTNHATDVFVRDLKRDKTVRVSVSSEGDQGKSYSFYPSISADGRVVAFTSNANLIDGGRNGKYNTDVFVHNLKTGRTRRASVSSSGARAPGGSTAPTISSNGRFVAFDSDADNLVEGDTNGQFDVFLRDMRRHRTERVSIDSAGTQGNGLSSEPSMSADGHLVAFDSLADNLVPNDTGGGNWDWDVFVHNRKTGKTTQVSVASPRAHGEPGYSYEASLSASGRFVEFTSDATDLASVEPRHRSRIFVRDLKRDKTKLVSVNSSGTEAHRQSYDSEMSGNGRVVAFTSRATNLVGGDTNGEPDVFAHDLKTHKTTRVSVSASGAQARSDSYEPSVSGDGRVVAFSSHASNLVHGDRNGYRDIFVRGPLR